MLSTAKKESADQDHDRWLVLIGVFKLLKGALFISLGFGVLKMVHRDLGEFLLRAALALRIDPEHRLVNLMLEKAEDLTPHRIRLIGYAIFLYALLDFIEGTGLVLEKVWAEYFTIVLTASFLPYELYEILRHFTWVKVILTLLNVLVLLYLVWHQQSRLRSLHRARHPRHSAK